MVISRVTPVTLILNFSKESHANYTYELAKQKVLIKILEFLRE